MMDWYGHGTGGWGYGLTALIMVLFWAAVIYGIVALVGYARRKGTQGREPVRPPAPKRLLASFLLISTRARPDDRTCR